MAVGRLVVFDMDGVLVDVTESYRASITETVEHFTGIRVSNDQIQQYKNSGGWNNDWALSQKLIADLAGRKVPYGEVVDYFNCVFLGADGRPGLILRERWMPEDGLLERLKRQHRLAIFTGRLRFEAKLTLDRFVPHLEWDAIMGDDDVTEKKPHPEGLVRIRNAYPESEPLYIGDTVDDARAAQAAGVPFVGIVHRGNPRHEEVVRLLEAHDAIAVLENINELETLIAKR